VTIREAMQELDVWGAETCFSTTEHAGNPKLSSAFFYFFDI
jgi:hypothetical protein